MKNTLLGLVLLTTLTTLSFAGEIRTEKKAKKAKSSTCEKGSGHACCMKKSQA